MCSKLVFLFGDQLTHQISSLEKINLKHDIIFMCEVKEEITAVKHHKQKIVFVLAAMRHFAEELRSKGARVHYVKYNDPDNTNSFDTELLRAIKQYQPKEIILTEPSEYRVYLKVKAWQESLSIPVTVLEDTRFLCSPKQFLAWAKGKKQLRMEYFYREMRKRYRILLEKNDTPTGGSWNYDKENRHGISESVMIPARKNMKHDAITLELIRDVERDFKEHFGSLASFNWAVTRKQALECLNDFIKTYLPDFGQYQDAMAMNQSFLFHSLLAPYINFGLLSPLEICELAEKAYREHAVPLNAAEGFIRQILGWREFVRGIYWLKMPSYPDSNYFSAKRDLPWFYWSGETDMRCIQQAVKQTEEHAYAHHIQRLMITGNFALLAGLDPKQVCEWYLIVYADALDWVELPNTLGMALFGDGGVLASKPYAASGKYINRMSNYCDQCAYDPNDTTGVKACPFNSLYWHFLIRNQGLLKNNNRLVYPYANWGKMKTEVRKAILNKAEAFLEGL